MLSKEEVIKKLKSCIKDYINNAIDNTDYTYWDGYLEELPEETSDTKESTYELLLFLLENLEVRINFYE